MERSRTAYLYDFLPLYARNILSSLTGSTPESTFLVRSDKPKSVTRVEQHDAPEHLRETEQFDPLLWQPRAAQNTAQDTHLCARCREFDFNFSFKLPSPVVKAEGIVVAELRKLGPSANVTADYPPCVMRTRVSEAFGKHIISIVVLCNNSGGHSSLQDPDYPISCGQLQYCISGDALLAKPKALYADIRAKLEQCQRSHEVCQERGMPSPIGAKVIDCSHRIVVPLTPEIRYTALSYVWGPRPQLSNVAQLESAHHDVQTLPESLPRTIEDAFRLTKALGYRYLWIDRYCISQHDSTDKAHQVNQMANIYSNSAVTICALGKDDQSGIPQLSISARIVDGCKPELSWTRDDWNVYNDIKKSAWRTRGWTLQEFAVAPRRLFITQEKTLMICNTYHYSDQKDSANLHRISPSKQLSRIDILSRIGWSPAARFDSLSNDYSFRQLGYESDTFNAFQAILMQLRVPSYWGIALCGLEPQSQADYGHARSESLEAHFSRALCWRSSERRDFPYRCITRRTWKELPTWSWLSLVGPTDKAESKTAKVIYHARLETLLSGGAYERLGTYMMTREHLYIVPAETKYLRMSSPIVSWTTKSGASARSNSETSGLRVHSVELTSCADHGLRWIVECSQATLYYDQEQRQGTTFAQEPDQAVDAILMIAQVIPSSQLVLETHWIAIKDAGNGFFERIGIISTTLARYVPNRTFSMNWSPVGDSLRQITLI